MNSAAKKTGTAWTHVAELRVEVQAVPRGQLRAAVALVGRERARTYREAAAVMGVHVGTLYTHLRRLRRDRPAVYAAFMAKRAEQLAARHAAAVARERAHSRAWFKRKWNQRYRERFGCWPWEARHRQRFGR